MRSSYPDDLIDEEWLLLEPILTELKKSTRGRKPKYCRREILNAIFYVLRTGCSWRHLPHDFPPWKAVYAQLMRWKKHGIFEKIHHNVRRGLRELLGRNQEPSASIADSQSVKTTDKRGFFLDSMEVRKLKGEKDIYWLILKD
jgi:transposase